MFIVLMRGAIGVALSFALLEVFQDFSFYTKAIPTYFHIFPAVLCAMGKWGELLFLWISAIVVSQYFDLRMLYCLIAAFLVSLIIRDLYWGFVSEAAKIGGGADNLTWGGVLVRGVIGWVLSNSCLELISTSYSINIPFYFHLLPVILCSSGLWLLAAGNWMATLGLYYYFHWWIFYCMMAGTAIEIIAVGIFLGISEGIIERKSIDNNDVDYSYSPPKPSAYPQQSSNYNNYEPTINKALDLAAGALKRDKTASEIMSGALQGDFSTTKVSKARAGAALVSVMLAAWAAKEKVGETTSRAGLEKQVDFGRKKLDNVKNNYR